MNANLKQQSLANSPDAPDTRDRILLEAARLFRHRGYAATTLRDIADAAGLKAGSIYYHFDSKEHIVSEVLDKGTSILNDTVKSRINALPENAPWRDRIAAGIDGHLWGILHHSDFISANIRIFGQIPASARNRHRIGRRAYSDYWDDLLNSALASGELRKDTSIPMIRLFVIGAVNWTVEWYNPQRGSFEDFSRQITAIVFDGIMQNDAA
jgi:AcrR family transcriptional regulator